MKRLSLLALAFLCFAAEPGLRAERRRTDLSPEEQKRYDDLIKSAESNWSMGILAMQAGAVVMGLGILWAAYSTWKNGFKITEVRRVEGTGAKGIALVLFLIGLGIAIGGVWYARTLGPPGLSGWMR